MIMDGTERKEVRKSTLKGKNLRIEVEERDRMRVRDERDKNRENVFFFGKHDTFRQAPTNRKCDLSDGKLSVRQTRTHQTVCTD